MVDLAYGSDTEVGSARRVVPDGRCGVALVDGVPWWFGPLTAPWTPPRPGVHVVGVRLSLAAGRRAAGGSLRQWRNTRARLGTMWAPAPVVRLAAQAARLGSDVERADLLVEAVLAHVDAVEPADGVGAALQRCVLAHYLADLEDDLAAEVAWDEQALTAFTHVHDTDLAPVGIPAAAGLAPSLHLNLGDGYLRQGHTTQAQDQLAAGLVQENRSCLGISSPHRGEGIRWMPGSVMTSAPCSTTRTSCRARASRRSFSWPSERA